MGGSPRPARRSVGSLRRRGWVRGHGGSSSRAAGIPDTAILIEDRSTTTRENLTHAAPILRAHGARPVLVTDPYHVPRARLLARQLGLQAGHSCPPVRSVGPRQWLRHVPREGLALIATLLRLR